MIEEIRKNKVIIEQRKYNAYKLTNILKNDKIINIEYDNYGNVVKLGNDKLEFGYLNLLYKYQNDNTYNFEYNYQGYRTKKIKENDYEVIYYRDSNKIIGEDVIDLNTKNVIRKFRYYYDTFGICGINYIIDETDHYYNLVKDSIGNVSKVMYKGKVIGEYTYDAWGNCEEVEIGTLNQIDKDVIKYNPFRYKGYYLDKETNLYYCNTRYYDPSLYMWLSMDSIGYLDTTSVNGINLYCYCNNNPVAIYKFTKDTFIETKSKLSIIKFTLNINKLTFNSRNSHNNYLNPHWKNEWCDPEWPSFFVLSKNGFEIINWGLTVYKGSLYLDNEEQHSIYNGSLNLSFYAGLNFEKNKYGVELGGSVGRLAYDGRFIDVQVDFLTAKFFFMYDNGKIKVDPGFGWFDFGISIDIGAFIDYVKGNG